MQRKLAYDFHTDIGQLLSPEDVAHVCGLSRRAVYRAIARGELRAARLCHRLRVRPEELERWIGAQTLAAESPARAEGSQLPRKVPSGGLRSLLDQAGDG
jgi:excisionase family DNA binding protein